MFIETVPNRSSPPAVLLRESYRDDRGRSQKRTLANLSKLPGDIIDALKALLKGGTVIGTGPGELEVERSLPHGHVAAALKMIRKIALDRLILSTVNREPSVIASIDKASSFFPSQPRSTLRRRSGKQCCTSTSRRFLPRLASAS